MGFFLTHEQTDRRESRNNYLDLENFFSITSLKGTSTKMSNKSALASYLSLHSRDVRIHLIVAVIAEA